MSDPSKLLAYFRSDLALRNGSRYLIKAQRDGCCVLARDSRAMATRAGVPCTLLDDWHAPETMVNALKVARDCAHQWSEPAEKDHYRLSEVSGVIGRSSVVRTSVADPAFGEEMRSKATDFSSRNLTDDACPGLAAPILEPGASGGNTRNRGSDSA
ncbi:MAG: hypothetical protein HY912_08050 [Desulfomonile tiedjei]|uniref:Uncharacterized protein n=1 Tax=Desulfomonile tiedjei TaxID=2358 RepID=A0A9D6Z3B2_9BACT|nr:hypothetical protein [Desulfomonile tiedjei]